jgi:hypothetical protein
MKSIKVFFVVIFLTANLYSQNWNNSINTQLSLQQALSADVFANIYGVNVLYQGYNGQTGIFYVLLSTTGTILKQQQIDSDGFSPLIVGDNNNLFAVYVKNGSLKVLRSTNLFTSWTDISPAGATNIPVSLPTSDRFQQNGAESGTFQMFHAAYRDLRLHVAWTEKVNNISEAYYSQYYLSVPGWIFNREEITSDYIGETGGRPRIAILPTHLIFSYNWLNAGGGLYGVVRTRYRYIDGPGWSSSITPFNGNSVGEDISADNTYIHLFYYEFVQTGSPRPLYHKKMLIGDSNWPGATQLSANVDTWNGVKCSKTTNGIFNISYVTFQISTPGSSNLIHRSFSNNTWSSEYTVSNTLGYSEFFGLSSVSNDLYVGWFNRESNSSKLYYRQYDAIPLAPQNLAVEIYSEGGNTYPKLTWSFNNEPDVYIKTNAYQVWRRYSLSGGAWSAWSVVGFSDGDENQYIDYTISGLYAEANTAEYKIKARDYSNYFSDYSSSVSINFSKLGKINTYDALSYYYELNQNYPNPFNPTTTISYSLKTAGLVTLSMFDMLGTKVASLVNEVKEAGNYHVTFNASELPSGIYFYTLTSGNFMATKKLILLK